MSFELSGPVEESINAQNMNIEDSDKNIKDRKRLLKYVRDKNRKKKFTITLDHKTGYVFTFRYSLLVFLVIKYYEPKMCLLKS